MSKKDRSEEKSPAAKKPQPEHYKVICISMYTDDLGELDEKVEALKKRGNYKANRSSLIRYALSLIDVDSISKEVLR